MAVDLAIVVGFLIYSSIGAVTRTVFGVYRAYANFMAFKLSWKRVAVEILASMVFGTFGALILYEVGVWTIGTNLPADIAAILAGFFGADIISILTKKFGLGKGIDVKVVEGIEYPDLNMRQQKAIEYIKKNGEITNSVYQKMNQVSSISAKWDLKILTLKNILKRIGNGRGAHYILRKDVLKNGH